MLVISKFPQLCDLIYKKYLIINYIVEIEIWGMGMGYKVENIEIVEVY